jgi:ribosomal protein L11 methyltransferase
VLANIISSVLIQLLPVIARSLTPDGAAILSGILIDEKRSVELALTAGGWRILEEDAEGMWWTVAITR